MKLSKERYTAADVESELAVADPPAGYGFDPVSLLRATLTLFRWADDPRLAESPEAANAARAAAERLCYRDFGGLARVTSPRLRPVQ